MAAFPHLLVPFLYNLIMYTFIFMIIYPSTAPTSFLAQADEKLIQSLCSKTQAPNFCLVCLHNDTVSQTADVLKLTAIYARCAEDHAKQLIQLIVNMEKRTPPGPLRAALSECEIDEAEVQGYFDTTETLVTEREIDEARAYMNSAKDYHNKCYQQFLGGAVPELPKLLIQPGLLVAADIEIILTMLQNI